MQSATAARDAICSDLLERGIDCGVHVSKDGDSIKIVPQTVDDYTRVIELGNLPIQYASPPVWIKVPTGVS